MREKLLSVIVPVYNTKTYLETCVNSILNQSYTAVEIILVDDGSEDGSAEICDRYAGEYANVKCIHKLNEGACYARRDGMCVASGEFVTFVDSDDYIDAHMYEVLMTHIIENDLDIVTSGFVFDNGNVLVDIFPEGIYEENRREEIYKQMVFAEEKLRSGMLCSVCTKIYRKELLEKYLKKVPLKLQVWEDLSYTYLPFIEAKKIMITHQTFYHYRQHVESTSHRYDVNLFDKMVYSFGVAEEMHAFCDEEIKGQLQQLIFHCLFIVLKDEIEQNRVGDSWAQYLRRIRTIVENEYFVARYEAVKEKGMFAFPEEGKLYMQMQAGKICKSLAIVRYRRYKRELRAVAGKILRPMKGIIWARGR